ncbi:MULTISPECIES: multidrug effflux MFS transporter [Moraxella]|uniref:Bcr/CflA family efflux transporter n=2 Tax=Bacteria TaxID=2 RepID=A0ABY0BJM9_MORCA|nr:MULTISPECIES: multidrug effflux MFS transporter [Moraxella]AIK01110.1 drug resistance transporter, Bcr/CflA subfamily protein [Moraxella catarrhalis]AXT97208.1 diaminohydroxyphosphoribosylaminopyrimidine deaminase [Moraxella catarrhalis]AXT98802.1 diaminohydroxyphosphoribosylaminopyrimidine deaminase [Moraxella catarrhalis]AZQ89190.1 drug resistance transporter, Bcr/CflA subfamily protein [Moraxella catarrhalis]EGE13549.1 Bcr/CflA subfamily drug resistance transporter [Moraxella catarrhalis
MTITNNQETKFPVLWVMMLGVMIAIGPLSIDMYLPAFPSMAEDFGVNVGTIAKSVPAYFLGLVFGQLFYGPFSDRIGRVRPLYLGMSIFIIASIICATTNNEYALFIARTLQALGACVTTVVTRAAIRDTLNPVQSARAFSLMVLVMGVAPILAPSLGALILKVADWHGIFWFLASFGVLNLLLTKCFLKETLKPENRNTRPMSESFGQYFGLIKDRTFMLPAVASGLLQGAFFIYLSISSELFMVNYQLTEHQFAIAFGVNAFGFIALTQVNQFLTKRFHLVNLLRTGAVIQLAAAGVLLILGLIFGGKASFYWVFASLFICIAGLGLTQPNATAIALAFQKKRAGLASALQGALQFSVGIFGGLLIGLFELDPVTRLGITTSILVVVGTFLVFYINPKLDLSRLD